MGKPVLPEEKQLMYDLYQELKSYTAVGKKLRRSPDTVSKYVKEVAKRKTLEQRHTKQLNETTTAIIHAVKQELGIDLTEPKNQQQKEKARAANALAFLFYG